LGVLSMSGPSLITTNSSIVKSSERRPNPTSSWVVWAPRTSSARRAPALTSVARRGWTQHASAAKLRRKALQSRCTVSLSSRSSAGLPVVLPRVAEPLTAELRLLVVVVSRSSRDPPTRESRADVPRATITMGRFDFYSYVLPSYMFRRLKYKSQPSQKSLQRYL